MLSMSTMTMQVGLTLPILGTMRQTLTMSRTSRTFSMLLMLHRRHHAILLLARLLARLQERRQLHRHQARLLAPPVSQKDHRLEMPSFLLCQHLLP